MHGVASKYVSELKEKERERESERKALPVHRSGSEPESRFNKVDIREGVLLNQGFFFFSVLPHTHKKKTKHAVIRSQK